MYYQDFCAQKVWCNNFSVAGTPKEVYTSKKVKGESNSDAALSESSPTIHLQPLSSSKPSFSLHSEENTMTPQLSIKYNYPGTWLSTLADRLLQDIVFPYDFIKFKMQTKFFPKDVQGKFFQDYLM